MTTEELFAKLKTLAGEIAKEKKLIRVIEDTDNNLQIADAQWSDSVYVVSYPGNCIFQFYCKAGTFSISYKLSDGQPVIANYTMFPKKEQVDIEAFMMPMKRLASRINKSLKK